MPIRVIPEFQLYKEKQPAQTVDEAMPLLEIFEPHALRAALAKALPGAASRPITAMYADGDDGRTLCARVCFSDVGFVAGDSDLQSTLSVASGAARVDSRAAAIRRAG